MKRLGLLLFVSSSVWAASNIGMEDLRMGKRFGIGVSAAGPLAAFGLEVEFNVSEDLSLVGGIGTGLDYSSIMGKAKYFLLGETVSPYFAAGFARWWTNGTNETTLGPSVLVNRFIPQQHDYSNGFDVWMVYPAVGAQFMHPMGLSIYAEIQYLFKLFNFANGTYAGLGVSWYF